MLPLKKLLNRKVLLLLSILILLLGIALATIAIHTKQDIRQHAAEGISYQKVFTYRGIGSPLDSVIGPGPVSGSQRLYVPYSYSGGKFQLVVVNPLDQSFNVFDSPLPNEEAARAIVVGADGKIYIGGGYQGHLYAFDPVTSSFTDLGKASSTESYIWSATLGDNGNIYLGTYPSGKLIRYSPSTGQFTDLGIMDTGNSYAEYVTYDGANTIYVAVGGSKMGFVAYDVVTGLKKQLLSDNQRIGTFAFIYTGTDNKIYGYAQWNAPYFLLSPSLATVITNNPPAKNPRILTDGRVLQNVGRGTYDMLTPSTGEVAHETFAYDGAPLAVQRLGIGPDTLVYGGSVMPAEMFSLNPQTNAVTKKGLIDLDSGGEIYSYLASANRLYMAGYYSIDFGYYDPSQPFSQGTNPKKNGTLPEDYRPEALVKGSNGKMYIGAVASYGSLSGYLVVADSSDISQVTKYQPFSNMGVSSLVEVSNAILVGGTTVRGGNGADQTATSVKLFQWNMASNTIVQSYDFGNGYTVTDLIKDKNSDRVFGIKYVPASGSEIFVYDPLSNDIVKRAPFLGSPIYNSLAYGTDGNLWGVASEGVFKIDPATLEVTFFSSPQPITAGFVMTNNMIYFASNSDIYSMTIVAPPVSIPTPLTTFMQFTAFLHGIGKAGDNTNELAYSLSNQNPVTTTKQLTVEVYVPDPVTALPVFVSTTSGNITYQPTTGNYIGTINMGTGLQNKSYIIKVKGDKYFKKTVGFPTVIPGTTINLPPVTLSTGDSYEDNNINIADYNVIYSCFSIDSPPRSCTPQQKYQADLNDDGNVDQTDYNLFVRESGNWKGD